MTSADVTLPRARTRVEPHPLVFVVPGIYFGILLIKAEVISWYRLQEMFRFQSFHMYGVIFSAVLVAWLAQRILARLGVEPDGREIPGEKHTRRVGPSQWTGGLLFGIGWSLSGTCPGPLFALLGNGVAMAGVILVSAIAGTWTYAHVRDRLPH